MTDRRLTPFSGTVALSRLRGQVEAAQFTEGSKARINAPLADLLRAPDGALDRQFLLGARVTVIEERGDWNFVEAEDDGYCGWIRRSAHGPDHDVTHRVSARATHVYKSPDIKAPTLHPLSLNARLGITGREGHFLRSHDGYWLPEQHLSPIDQPSSDPVTVAETLLGTPYLWGGNSFAGVDCSGLVQLALHACGHPCPGDSDLQERALGTHLPEGTTAQRGDLLFWRGHVAWVSAPDMILHANAHSMSVAYEPLDTAIARISAESPVTAHIRPL